MESPHDATASSRKRPSSNEEPPEKRQRISDDGRHLVTPEFAELISHTAVSLGNVSVPYNGNSSTQSILNSSQYALAGDTVPYDPYYNMRILSLPILESLVCVFHGERIGVLMLHSLYKFCLLSRKDHIMQPLLE